MSDLGRQAPLPPLIPAVFFFESPLQVVPARKHHLLKLLHRRTQKHQVTTEPQQSVSGAASAGCVLLDLGGTPEGHHRRSRRTCPADLQSNTSSSMTKRGFHTFSLSSETDVFIPAGLPVTAHTRRFSAVSLPPDPFLLPFFIGTCANTHTHTCHTCSHADFGAGINMELGSKVVLCNPNPS